MKSRADNAEVMLIITQQSQPVTQAPIAFKELFLSPGRCWVWMFLGELSGPGCPRSPQAPGMCSCLRAGAAPAQAAQPFTEFPAVLTLIYTGCDPNLCQSSLRCIRSFHLLALVFPPGSAELFQVPWKSPDVFPAVPFLNTEMLPSGTDGFPQVLGGRGINLTLKNNSVTSTEFHMGTKTLPSLNRDHPAQGKSVTSIPVWETHQARDGSINGAFHILPACMELSPSTAAHLHQELKCAGSWKQVKTIKS